MVKTFQKALLLCPAKYSLYNSTLEILNELSFEVKRFDIREKLSAFQLKVQTQLYRFPFKVREFGEKNLLQSANKEILDEIHSYNPDLVFVYNSEYLLPETCNEIRKTAILIFFMGDSPFFTHTNPHYLSCLQYANLILSPDTFWMSQLNTVGIHRTYFFIPGIDLSSYHLITDEKSLEKIELTDIFYTGASYVNSWGYKKALLMSKFIGQNFKLYGNRAWKRWFNFFPGLESHYTESGYIPTEQLNIMFNRSKLMPVDGNPSILNGFHIRLFEALGAGVLPLVEYRKDIEEQLFKGCDINVPQIRDYTKAADLAKYYLKNEEERKELLTTLREFILSNYNAKINSERLIELIMENSIS